MSAVAPMNSHRCFAEGRVKLVTDVYGLTRPARTRQAGGGGPLTDGNTIGLMRDST